MKPSSKIFVSLFIVIIAFAGIFIYSTLSSNDGHRGANISELSGPNNPDEGEDEVGNVNDNVAEADDELDDEEKEDELAIKILHMTNQKVHADIKTGHLEITDERINKLLEEAKRTSYDSRDFYIETLTDWKNGDFDNVMGVHNVIWSAHSLNNTEGDATGFMSEEEESEYIEKHFR